MNENTNIHLFEEHSSTLPVWWQHHSSPNTVVYLDAHLDLQHISAERIARLQACTKLEEFQALEAPNHLNLSPRFAYGIENFLYAAQQLGYIERLIWVAPPHIPRHYSSSLVDYIQQMDGLDFDDLTGFSQVGKNALHGRMLGLDITICDYDDLEFLEIEAGYYLDIDIDYFVEVPADRLWIDPATVINSITIQLGRPSLTTMSRAVTSGFMPLAFRFVGDYIHELLTGYCGNVAYYQELTRAVTELGKGEFDKGKHRVKRLITDWPDLADAYYISALCSGDLSAKREFLREAETRNGAYRFDLARDSIGLLHRKKQLSPVTIQKLINALDALEEGSEQRIFAEVALAQVSAVSGDVPTAMSLISGLSGDYANHEDVLISVVIEQLGDVDKRDQNRHLLSGISKGDKNSTIAYLYLGDIEFSDERYQKALDYYHQVAHKAPAWMLPLERMLKCFQVLGMKAEENSIREIIAFRHKRLSRMLNAG